MNIKVLHDINMSNPKWDIKKGKYEVKGTSQDPANNKKSWMVYLENGYTNSVYSGEFDIVEEKLKKEKNAKK